MSKRSGGLPLFLYPSPSPSKERDTEGGSKRGEASLITNRGYGVAKQNLKGGEVDN